jgi:hypothetical protein
VFEDDGTCVNDELKDVVAEESAMTEVSLVDAVLDTVTFSGVAPVDEGDTGVTMDEAETF